MKQTIFLSIACGLLMMSCATTKNVSYVPQYPRGAELNSGHHGQRVYTASTLIQQDGYAKYYTYCDTAEKIVPRTPFTRLQTLAVVPATVAVIVPVKALAEEKLSVLALIVTTSAVTPK